MKKSKLILALFVLFLLKTGTTAAQIDTAFWFACPWVTPDHWWKDDIKFHIASFSAPSTTVHVRQPGLAPLYWSRIDTTFVIPANTNVDVAIWRKKIANATTLGFDSTEVRPANTVKPFGIYISTTSSVTIVYDVITRQPNFYNPETFSLMGQNGLGYEFVCPFQTKWRNQNLGGDLNGDGVVTQPKQQINVVASKANTVIWITPKTNVIGHLANVTYSVLLPAPGSAYTIENTVQNTNVAGNNLSGTIVVADKPISVTVADDSVAGVTGCYDLMGEQIVPVDVIGKNYILNKGYMNAPEPEGAYVVATKNFTKLTINDGVITTTLMNKGDTYHYKTTQPLTYINADSSVYCLHASGTGCELGEALLPPLECAGSNLVAFSRTNNQGFYLNLLIKAPATSFSLTTLNSFTLNNSTGTVTVPIGITNFTLVPGTNTIVPGFNFFGGQLNLSNISTLPIGSYTVYNPTDVFALGVFGGNGSTGGLFHYMSSFVRRPTVVAQPSMEICANPSASVMITGTVTGGTSTGNWSTSGSGSFGVYTSSLNIISVPYYLSTADTLLSTIPFILTSIDICGKTYTTSTFVKINQKPQILVSGNTNICKNATNLSVTLSGTLSPGTTLAGSWSGGNGGSFGGPGANTVYNPSPSDLSVGTITLTLTGIASFTGCPNTAKSIIVNYINPPVVSAGSNTTACTNSQSITLNGSITSGTSNLVWATNGSGLFIPNNSTTTPVYQFSAGDLLLPTISFTLNSVAVGGGCTGAPDVMQINIIPKPFVAAPNDFTICATTTVVVLTGTVGGSASAGTWTSTGSGAYGPSAPANLTYSLSQNDLTAGVVQFTLNSSGGICPSEADSVKLTIQQVPIITISTNSISICKNAPILLNATIVGGTTYTWVPPSSSTGYFSPPGANVLNALYNPSAPDIAGGPLNFTILVSNPPCTPSQNTVTAYFIPSPKALFTYPNIGRCLGSSIPFTNASLDNGTAPLTYTWNFGAGGSTSIAQDPIYTYTNVGSYIITLTVTGAFPNNCPDTVSKRITIYPLPIANFSVISGCQNINSVFQNLSIAPGGGGSITAMSWSFGDNKPDLLTGFTPTVGHLYDNAGPYNAVLTVTTNLGCKSSTIVPLNVSSQPVAEFGLTNNPAVAQEPIYFSDFSTPTGGIVNWLWQFGDESSASGNAPSHSFQNPGIYIIKLTVEDANGCSDTISKSIEISLLPQVPTAFTPNGDNNNDLLFVKGGPFQNMVFKVYNNWGELLFETTDQKVGWDGKKDGQIQPLGVYVWTLVVDMYNNRQVRKNGDITLIR